MKNNLFIFVFITFTFILFFHGVSASTNGIFMSNGTDTIANTSAEFDVVANISATEYWAEISLNTSEIGFGSVKRNTIFRAMYRIQARGNVNISVKPRLSNEQDIIFSNLFFSRTTQNPERIGEYKMLFNLAENKGFWSVIGSSDELKNLSGTYKGEQNIKLDLSNFNEVIPFDVENYRNTVIFEITPIYNQTA